MNIKYTLSKIKEYGVKGSIRKISKKFLFNKYPEHINIEIMTVCNLRCKHCRVAYYGKEIPDVKPGFMDFNLFRKIVDRISTLAVHAFTFQFSSIEPLFHKDLFKMMDYVSSYNKNLFFPLLSNGMLLSEGNIHELCSRNVPSISISLDGCTKKTVESFKTGVNFDKVVDNIRLLKKMAGSKIKLYTIFIITTENKNELLDYIDFCADLKVDGININGFQCFLPEMSNLYLYSKNGNPEIFELFQRAYDKAKDKSMIIKFPSLTAKKSGCDLTSYISIDQAGNVSPCILLSHKTPLELFSRTSVATPVVYGNVLSEDSVSIWNKKDYQDFRRKLKIHDVPQACFLCADAYGVICSNSSLQP